MDVPPWKSMELHPGILSFATSAVAKIRIINGTKECFRYFFIRCSIKKKSCPEKFRFKFMDAYIHIRSKLNPSCDSVRLIEVMKACIYTWLNLNLKPFFSWPKSCLMMLNVKSRLQIRIFTRKSLFDWKIMLNFAALNIKKVKINIKRDI